MAILTVGLTSTYDSITSAMLDALPGDTIALEAGFSNETAVVTKNNLTIFGEAGSLGIILQLSLGIPTVTLTGTAPINILDATDGNGIVGNAGDNQITVSGGVDAVDGGLGTDRLVVDYRLATGAVTGASTSNFTEAGGGGRSVTVTDGTIENFTILTGSEADTITTGPGNDMIRTGDGASTINAGQGANTIIGGDNADTITALDGGNEIDAGNGANTVTTGSGVDTILTGTDADTVSTGGGDDEITLLGGIDSVDAGAGNDRLIIDYSAMTGDVVGGITGGNIGTGYTGHIADAGTNIIDFVGSEQFTITTGSGNDSILTGGGNDTIDGGLADDTISAGDGNDEIRGGQDNDVLFGEGGNDTLQGGAGSDSLTGGAGADVFVIENGMGNDTITDYDVTEDSLDMSSLTTAEQDAVTNTANTAGDRVVTLGDGSTLTMTGVPVNSAPTGALVIDGIAAEDQTLTANISGVSDADGLGTFAFQWIRGGADITGATANTYQLTQADVGQEISVRATYTDNSGTDETVTSSATSAVSNVNDAPTGLPIISGSAVVGGTLSVSTTSIADEDGLGSFTFQWLRGGSVIIGANAATYALVAADVGQALSVVVDYIDGQSTAESLVSATTAAVVTQSPGQTISGTDGSDNLSGGTADDNIGGAGGNDIIIGDLGNDNMGGGTGNDTMDGSDGHDTMGGGQGDDVMDGGNGNDIVNGGPGNDILSGAGGNDTMGGSQGDDTIDGGEGDDSVGGGTGKDFLIGGNGNDIIGGGEGDDTVQGDAGNDFLVGGGRDDVIDGGLGNDTINGGDGNDIMTGGLDDDIMNGGAGDDTLDGGAGDDTFDGGFSTDLLLGGDGNDNMAGGQGDDTLDGGAGDDSLGGGSGKDSISGNEGDDSIGGGEGDDTVQGDAGNDFLAGGGRNDVIDGGLGNDTINGGDGDDIMTGGDGADVFVFNFFKDGDDDVITDYEDGVDSFLIRVVNPDTGEVNLDNGDKGLQGFVVALNFTDTAAGAQVNIGGHLVTVEGMAAADLTQDDFSFL